MTGNDKQRLVVVTGELTRNHHPPLFIRGMVACHSTVAGSSESIRKAPSPVNDDSAVLAPTKRLIVHRCIELPSPGASMNLVELRQCAHDAAQVVAALGVRRCSSLLNRPNTYPAGPQSRRGNPLVGTPTHSQHHGKVSTRARSLVRHDFAYKPRVRSRERRSRKLRSEGHLMPGSLRIDSVRLCEVESMSNQRD